MKNRIHWMGLLSVLVLIGFTTHVFGEEAAVIISRDVGPYEEAMNGFKTDSTMSCKIYPMQGDRQKGAEILKTIEQKDYHQYIAIGTEAGLLLNQGTGSVPVVYTMVLSPLQFSRRNSAGVYIKIDVDKQLAKIKKLFPDKRRIGLIYHLQTSSKDVALARKTVARLGQELSPIAVENRDEIPQALAKLNSNAVDLIWMLADSVVGHPESVKQFIAHAQKENIPLIAFSLFHVKAGALAAFSADYYDIGKQTASLAKKMKSSGLKNYAEGPRKIVVYVNPKVQKQLGIGDLSTYSEVQYVQ